jgi:hypothetical protein
MAVTQIQTRVHTGVQYMPHGAGPDTTHREGHECAGRFGRTVHPAITSLRPPGRIDSISDRATLTARVLYGCHVRRSRSGRYEASWASRHRFVSKCRVHFSRTTSSGAHPHTVRCPHSLTTVWPVHGSPPSADRRWCVCGPVGCVRRPVRRPDRVLSRCVASRGSCVSGPVVSSRVDACRVNPLVGSVSVQGKTGAGERVAHRAQGWCAVVCPRWRRAWRASPSRAATPVGRTRRLKIATTFAARRLRAATASGASAKLVAFAASRRPTPRTRVSSRRSATRAVAS